MDDQAKQTRREVYRQLRIAQVSQLREERRNQENLLKHAIEDLSNGMPRRVAKSLYTRKILRRLEMEKRVDVAQSQARADRTMQPQQEKQEIPSQNDLHLLKHTRHWRRNRNLTKQKGKRQEVASSFFVRTNRRSATYCFVFLGEWGYEILASHGWLRRLKMENPKVTVGIASRAGAEFLYEDAYDVYIDITDVLARYRSSMFGISLLEEDYAEIESRCRKAFPNRQTEVIYSNRHWTRRGIEYGCRSLYSQTRLIRNPHYLKLQIWKPYELKELKREYQEIKEAFPGLLGSDYILVQDRRRISGWGRQSYSAQTWHSIINYLVDAGYKPVLIGYKPWKVRDSTSIFYDEMFKHMDGVINVSDFLTEHLGRNLAYQAVLVKHCKFWLGVWGSASMLPPLMGKISYALSAARGSVQKQERQRKAWSSAFARCKGNVVYLNTTLELDSALVALRKARILNGKHGGHQSKSLKVSPSVVKKNRVAVVTLSWNRLFYTKHCWGTLHEKAGMPFDHFVIDNGSTDGTVEWLKENESMFAGIIYNSKNLGIAVARTQSLQFLGSYDWFIMGPNDVEILTDDFITQMAEFWELTHGKYLFSPRLQGIRRVIPALKTYKIGQFAVEEVGLTGGCFMALPTRVFKDYVQHMRHWRVRELCRLAKKRGIKNLYLPELKVNHFESTGKQFKRYPNLKVGYNRELGPVPLLSYEGSVDHRPFMTFVTRCYKRPKALKKCKASIQAQTDQDFEHIFIVDEIGQGIGWANKQFYTHRKRVRGEYVYLVDDDAYITDPNFVAAIKKVAAEQAPDVIMVKLYIYSKEYPTPEVWEKYPIRGKIAGGCICVTNKVYQDYIQNFGHPKAGDYYFIKSVFDAKGLKIVWLDRNVKSTGRMRGRPEAQ